MIDGTHEIGRHHNGGYDYKVMVSGLTMTGWRAGTREQVEAYLLQVVRNCKIRAAGGVVWKNKDGSIRKSHLKSGARYKAMNGC